MSFQADLDNIKTKTGKTPEDFKKLAKEKGLLDEGFKAGALVDWLKKDFGLGHGHAMAIYAVLKKAGEKKESVETGIARHFSGSKSVWRSTFDLLLTRLEAMGDDISIAPTNSYLSILRGDRKMALVQVTSSRMDIGIKLKGIKTNKRFEPADSWNTMMTHRVRLTSEKQIDNELLDWLRGAYEQNGKVR